MPSSLPLQAQIGIRDYWKREDAPVQVSFRNLEEVLGQQVVINPEWDLLLTELLSGGVHDNAKDLVATIAETVQVWCKSLVELLDGADADAEWTDKLLEKTGNNAGRLKISLDVRTSHTQAGTMWLESLQGFVITFPKKQRIQPAELFPIFRGALSKCFGGGGATSDEGATSSASTTGMATAGSTAGGADDWADVEVDSTTGTPSVFDGQQKQLPLRQQQQQQHYPGGVTKPVPSPYLPTVASLPRPDELLLKPPYHLHIRHAARGVIEIQGSHSPSLQLLADYLKKWCRVNHQDTRSPPAVTVRLHQSPFGLGEMFDRLTLSTHDTRYTDIFQVTVPMILTLVEKVLGYEAVSPNSSSQGSVWEFRRDAEILKAF